MLTSDLLILVALIVCIIMLVLYSIPTTKRWINDWIFDGNLPWNKR